MSFVDKMKRLARDFGNVLVLPESKEERTLKAARIIVDEKLVSRLILVGNKEEVESVAEKRLCLLIMRKEKKKVLQKSKR